MSIRRLLFMVILLGIAAIESGCGAIPEAQREDGLEQVFLTEEAAHLAAEEAVVAYELVVDRAY